MIPIIVQGFLAFLTSQHKQKIFGNHAETKQMKVLKPGGDQLRWPLYFQRCLKAENIKILTHMWPNTVLYS